MNGYERLDMRNISEFAAPRRAARVLVALLAVCAMALALTSCMGSNSQQEKTPAQLNREYMSNVNRISAEAADQLANFGEAAEKGDVAAMRLAAADAAKSLDKIEALEAPDALKDVHSEYLAGVDDLSGALTDYVNLYAQLENAGDDEAAKQAVASQIADVKAKYDSGIEHLSKADSMVADMANAGSEDQGQNQNQDQSGQGQDGQGQSQGQSGSSSSSQGE